MSSENKKVGRREKYPFATWKVGDEFSTNCTSDCIAIVSHRLSCSAVNRKKDKSWSFEVSVKDTDLKGISTVTIRRVK